MTKKMTKKEEFEQMKLDYNQKTKALDDRTRQLDTSITDAQQITKELSSKKYAIESFFEEMNATQESLQEQKNELNNNIQSVSNDIQNAHDRITEFSTKKDAFDEEHVRIFGEGGLKQEIDTVRKALATYRGEQETAIQTLKEHIESLMPNATSVGLAKAFSDEKEIFKEETEKYSKYFMASICLPHYIGCR